jgi:hypothetical protein
MSTVREMADAEAARAEAEGDETPATEGDETPPAEPTPADPAAPGTDEGDEDADADETRHEQEPPSEPPPPQDSLTISDELHAKREKQAKTQAENVEKLANEYGQDVAECPVCERVDLAALIVAKVRDIPAEGWQQLAGVGGHEPAPPRRMAEGVEECDRCNGYGELDYPTRNPHMQSQTCHACTGNGYVLVPQAEQPPAPVFQLPAIPSPSTPAPPAFAGNDPWGRPAGHPHYNLDPAAVMP